MSRQTPTPPFLGVSLSTYYKDNTLGSIDLALNVPLLDNVCLNNITLRPSSYALFNNVRRLALTQTSSRPFEEMTIETVLQILTHCQLTLDEFEVRTTGPHDPRVFSGKTPNGILVLLRLRRLVWKTRSISPSLLSLIAAPALQTLHIIMEQTNVVEDFSQLIPVSIVQLSECLQCFYMRIVRTVISPHRLESTFMRTLLGITSCSPFHSQPIGLVVCLVTTTASKHSLRSFLKHS